MRVKGIVLNLFVRFVRECRAFVSLAPSFLVNLPYIPLTVPNLIPRITNFLLLQLLLTWHPDITAFAGWAPSGPPKTPSCKFPCDRDPRTSQDVRSSPADSVDKFNPDFFQSGLETRALLLGKSASGLRYLIHSTGDPGLLCRNRFSMLD